ncbi:alpha/beta fold hydrolase [Enterovirga sp. CN4-39]|uniref:alpha/beta fold hydrolase n=1 Tax=Enterovirga sp. CN4-39 TaxID=3400910 RepID=UPI003C063BD2
MSKVTQTNFAQLKDVKLAYWVSGEGEPVMQIHGSGFGHGNFAPVTPILARRFKVYDYDQRGYGRSDRPHQTYSIEVWADDLAALMDALGIERAHIHGTSMGGMVAIAFAGKYPEKTKSVIINCAAAKPGLSMRLRLKNYIDLMAIDSRGMASPILGEMLAREALSKTHLETDRGREAVSTIARIVRENNDVEVFTAASRAIMEMDLTLWLPKITSPALVIGGDEDHMTRWDQGPNGVGQEGIYQAIRGAEKYVIRGSSHSSIFDATEEYSRVVLGFLLRHAGLGSA